MGTGSCISRNADTNFPVFSPIADKAPQTIVEVWSAEYPGRVEDHRAPELVFCDNGGEFQAEFSAHVREKGGTIQNSVPDAPQTNSGEERFHFTLQGCIKASMVEADAPSLKLWAACGRHVTFNYARLPDGRKDGKAP